MKIKLFILAIIATVASLDGFAQRQWTLKECIDYAIINNIQVKQSELSIKQSEIRLNTSRNSRLPSISASLSGNSYFGRGQSRDGVYTDNNGASASLGINVNQPIYQGSRIVNTIKSDELDLKATIHNFENAKEDLSLNIVSLYMQILFNKELLRVAETQLELSTDFVERSKILYTNGRIPESEYYESISLMARDKLTHTESNNRLVLSILDLAQALNKPNSAGFDIVSPSLDALDKVAVMNLVPAEEVYDVAVQSRPNVLSETYRLKSFEQDLKVVKSAYYPSISLGLGYGNSYHNVFSGNIKNQSFGEQMRLNGSETIGLSVSIPIFNRLSTRNQVRQTNVSISQQALAVEDVKIKLRKEIEQSYYNAEASRQNYQSSHEALKAAEIAFRFEEQKANSGRSTIFDFNDSKTRLVVAESELLRAKYQYLFNKKILDFYNGVPLTN